MFRNFRDGRFALGLVAGIGITLFVLLLPYPAENGLTDKIQDAAAETAQNQQDGQEYTNGQNFFEYWARRLISMEDTAAQWLMTVFSIVAAFLLWRTLLATQKMAADTRRIGERQVRAYVGISSIGDNFDIEKFLRGQLRIVDFTFKNYGASPAGNLRFMAAADIVGHPKRFLQRDAVFAQDGQHRPNDTMQAGATAGGHAQIVGDHTESDILDCIGEDSPRKLYVFGVIEYEDIFGTPCRTRFNMYADFRHITGPDGERGLELRWGKADSHNEAT